MAWKMGLFIGKISLCETVFMKFQSLRVLVDFLQFVFSICGKGDFFAAQTDTTGNCLLVSLLVRVK